MIRAHSHKAFLALVRAGLWEKSVELRKYGTTNFDEIMRLAEEQSVIGLVTAGLEHVTDVKVPQEWLLQFIGQSLQIEQQNIELNTIIPKLFKKLRKEDVEAVMVKGQGVAQCYEKPQWRASGDVDLLLDTENYEKAKTVLIPIGYDVEAEDTWKKHQALKIMGVEVELHGKMPFGLSDKADEVIDEVIYKTFNEHESLGKDEFVLVPMIDEHVFLVFTHYLRHFFIEGVGLRQICDWCRLLWSYRESMNYELLETRIRKAGLVTEWQVFASLAVNYLGMPKETMPLLNLNDNHNANLRKKAEKVLKRILKSGNFGHNNDLSYRSKYKGMIYKIVATWRRFVEFASLMPIFPLDAPRFYMTYVYGKLI